jgi:hypothetical protein
MPGTDSLRESLHDRLHILTSIGAEHPEPQLSEAERKVVKSMGGWTAFMQMYSLKPTSQDDVQEGLAIIRQMVKNDQQ